MRQKAVLFDLDETLTDRQASLIRAGKRLYDTYGVISKKITLEQVLDTIKSIETEACKKGLFASRRMIAEELLDRLDWESKPSSKQLEEFWEVQYPISVKPECDLKRLVAKINGMGYSTGVVTNGPCEYQKAKIKALKIDILMDMYVISEEVGVAKPCVDIFHMALKTLGVDPSNAWFIGDNPYSDIQGAKNAGMVSVWKNNGRKWPSAYTPPDFIISSITEIVDLLYQSNKEATD